MFCVVDSQHPSHLDTSAGRDIFKTISSVEWVELRQVQDLLRDICSCTPELPDEVLLLLRGASQEALVHRQLFHQVEDCQKGIEVGSCEVAEIVGVGVLPVHKGLHLRVKVTTSSCRKENLDFVRRGGIKKMSLHDAGLLFLLVEYGNVCSFLDLILEQLELPGVSPVGSGTGLQLLQMVFVGVFAVPSHVVRSVT